MWFRALMGFNEESPEQVRANIEHDGEFLTSRVNGRRVRCGRLTIPRLSELRAQVGASPSSRRATVSEVVADVRDLHRHPSSAGALFQVASQFNLLEMVGPSVTPEEGVELYEGDLTQGPACAVTCGGGTIYRNYFVPVGDQIGQTTDHQIDCLADLGATLGNPGLWEMRNGYALASEQGLETIGERLHDASDAELDALRGLLRVGVQHDVEVVGPGHLVTQVYGSALPVAYGVRPADLWEPFARLILEASYEATFLVARREQIGTVYLTRLGGGAFGNRDGWIEESVLRALSVADGLDVRFVSHRVPSEAVARIIERC